MPSMVLTIPRFSFPPYSWSGVTCRSPRWNSERLPTHGSYLSFIAPLPGSVDHRMWFQTELNNGRRDENSLSAGDFLPSPPARSSLLPAGWLPQGRIPVCSYSLHFCDPPPTLLFLSESLLHARLELQAGMTQRSACRQGLVSLSLPPSWGNECYLGALSLAGHGFMPSSIHIININKMGVIILVDRVILRI